MKAEKNNGFTLIELIAVLVILAILALIVTPIVLNIVKNAKDAANKRSVDAYGKTVELSVATYMLDNGEYPTCQSDLKIEYSGNEVNCNIMNLNENGSVYLSGCTVGGKEVKDSSTDDGWYHYGKSIGESNNLNQSYQIGDIITYSNIDFYVIENSDEDQDYVTLLKATVLNEDEVNIYGAGHINNYSSSHLGVAGIDGSVAYYTSSTCGYIDYYLKTTGCQTNYANSEVKYIVDAWSISALNPSDLKEDSLGYKVRLITTEELFDNLGFEIYDVGYIYGKKSDNTPDWLYNMGFIDYIWTMSAVDGTNDSVYGLDSCYGDIEPVKVYEHIWTISNGNSSIYIRPVINLYKSAINNSNLQESSNTINLKCS